MRFQDLVDGLVSDEPLRAAIDALLRVKRASQESQYGQPMPAINAFIERELARLEQAAPPVSTLVDFAVLDRLLLTTVSGSD